MLKKLIVILIPIVLLVGFVVVVNDKKTDAFFLVKEEGQVFFKGNDTESYLEVKQDEISVANGTYVKTSEFSSAHIVLPDNSVISLDEQTEIQIKFIDDSVEVMQLTGNTWNRVETLTSGNSFTVKSGDTVVDAQGTIFHFEVKEDETVTAAVEEHSVVLSEGGQEVIVSETESAFTTPTGEITKLSTEDSFKKTRWYLRNKVLDQIKRTGLDNIFLKDKLKKEFIRDELVQTRFNIVSPDVESSLLTIEINSEDTDVCSNVADIPQYVEYSRYGELYSTLLTSCDDEELSDVEIEKLNEVFDNIL